MAIFIAASRQVVGLLSCPYTEICPIFPPYSSINSSLCTKNPPEPMAGSYTRPLLSNKPLPRHKESARTKAGTIHTALEGFQHPHHQFHNAFGRIILSAFLASCKGKLTEKILIHMTRISLEFRLISSLRELKL